MLHLHPISICPYMQLHCQTINENFAQANHKLSQYFKDSEQLNSQIDHLQQQQTAILSDKDQVLQQNSDLNSSLLELQQLVQELEAQRDQLEHDKYVTQTSLEQLEADHEKVQPFSPLHRPHLMIFIVIVSNPGSFYV